jgi:ABC-type nickel/cobalt efflux system permease component RcnA
MCTSSLASCVCVCVSLLDHWQTYFCDVSAWQEVVAWAPRNCLACFCVFVSCREEMDGDDAMTHTYTYTHMHLHVHIYTHKHTQTHIHTRANTHARTTHTRTHTHPHTHAPTHARTMHCVLQGVVNTSDGKVVRAFHRFTLVDQTGVCVSSAVGMVASLASAVRGVVDSRVAFR